MALQNGTEGRNGMNREMKIAFGFTLLVTAALLAVQATAPKAEAIPAFARKYHTACATCHSNWPELNDFGLACKF